MSVSDPREAPEEESDPAKSVLLSSVSPSLLVTLGAVSASLILLTVVVAVIYIKRVRKREVLAGLRTGESLRSSLQLSPDDSQYLEKRGGGGGGGGGGGSHCTVTLSSSDSYDTLASFTQVPVVRPGDPSWASGNEYACPLSQPAFSSWRDSPGPGLASPLILRHGGAGQQTRWGPGGDSQGLATPSRRVRPSQQLPPPPPLLQYQYSTVPSAREGEASPYSVSSELYKHVLPQYWSNTRGSVLV